MAVGVARMTEVSGGSAQFSGVLFQDRVDHYFRPDWYSQLHPNVAPFLTFVTKLNSFKVPAPDFKMFQYKNKVVDDFKFYVKSTETNQISVNNTEVTLSVTGVSGQNADVGFLTKGLVCQVYASNAYKATVVVTGVTSQQQIDVKCIHLASGSSYTFTGSEVLHVVGSAHGETDSYPEAWREELTTLWNSTQIVRTSLKISDRLRKAALRGATSELGRLQIEKALEQKIKVARTFYFGNRPDGLGAPGSVVSSGIIDPDTGDVLYFTQGIISAIENQVTLSGRSWNYFQVTYGAYDWDAFVDHMEQLYQYANAEQVKYAFVGMRVWGWFSKIESGGFLGNSAVGARVYPSEISRRFGFRVTRIEHPFGVLNLVLDPLLRGKDAGYMLVVDPENIGRAWYQQPQYRANIQNPGQTIQVDEYLNDEGLWFTAPERHALWKFS